MIKKTWISVVLILMISSASMAQSLKEGPWRFEIKTAHATIPFIVELKFNKKRLEGRLYNGKETIPLKNITYIRNSLTIPLQAYEITLELKQESPERLSGLWIRHNKNPRLENPVTATYGITERFTDKKLPSSLKLNGKWAVTLKDEEKKETPGIIIFEQEGSSISGSILTPTGDYRYFEGYVSGENFMAASFDGMFNYLLSGEVKEGKLEASILSNYLTKIEGNYNQNATLPDSYKQTQVEALNFNFPNLQGKTVSLKDPSYVNKPVIIQFFGSWCPNCIDEMNFLVPWYNENKQRGVEIIALAFERSLSKLESKRQLNKIQKKYKVPYTLLVAGETADDKPMEKIPGLKNFISFPTTVFLNKKHEVFKVHAGFTGPSTGEFYEKWKTEFNETVNDLLK